MRVVFEGTEEEADELINWAHATFEVQEKTIVFADGREDITFLFTKED